MNVLSKAENMAIVPKSVDKKFGRPRKTLDPLLQKWSDRLSLRNSNTAQTYSRYVGVSLEELNVSADELLSKLGSGEWNVYDKLGELLSIIHNNAPYSINGQMNALRRFLAFNDIEVDEKKFQAKVLMPKNYIVLEDRIPDKDELSSMFNTATEKGRVVIILGIHGLRIGEMATLKVKDLKLGDDIPHLVVKAETAKERKGRIVPLTPQAIDVLKTYLKTQGLKDEDGILGVSTKSIAHIVFRILDKLGIKERDERTGYHKIHVHCFRKYCKTMLSASGCQDWFVDKILGHRKYLDASYLRANQGMIAEQFNKAIPSLTIGAIQIKSKESDKVMALETRIDFLTKNLARLLEIGEWQFREAYEKTVKGDREETVEEKSERNR